MTFTKYLTRSPLFWLSLACFFLLKIVAYQAFRDVEVAGLGAICYIVGLEIVAVLVATSCYGWLYTQYVKLTRSTKGGLNNPKK